MADIWMDVDTALGEVPINIMPLLDDTDFKTIESSVVYNASGLALFWNFVTTAGVMTCTAVTPTSGGDYDWTDQGSSGTYAIEMPASGGASANNDTEGFGWFTGVATGVLPWRGPVIGFRAAATNNSLVDGTTIDVNTTAISGDVTAADRLETMLDGTGGNTLSLGRLVVLNSGSGNAVEITGGSSSGAGVDITGGSTNGPGLRIAGTGAGTGMSVTGGSTGLGMTIFAPTGADALQIATIAGNGNAVTLQGSGTQSGLKVVAGATGNGATISGGGTSGDGVHITATSGDGIDAAGGGAGVGIRADITGNLTGTVTDVVNGVAIETGGITALSFAAGAIDAAAIAANAIGASEIAANAITSTKIDTTAYGAIADAVADEAYDGSVTLRQSTRLANSANGAKLSGAATTTVAIRDLADSKDRVTASVDADGNRSAVTLDLA